MHQHSTDPLFEQSLLRCTGPGEVHKLIEKNSDRNTKIFKKMLPTGHKFSFRNFLKIEAQR